jgi:hypothetical protein
MLSRKWGSSWLHVKILHSMGLETLKLLIRIANRNDEVSPFFEVENLAHKIYESFCDHPLCVGMAAVADDSFDTHLTESYSLAETTAYIC